jgi:hypothetical protein
MIWNGSPRPFGFVDALGPVVISAAWQLGPPPVPVISIIVVSSRGFVLDAAGHHVGSQ